MAAGSLRIGTAMLQEDMIVQPNEPVLVTGATGFIGAKVVENLLERGFRHIRCFARPSSAKIAMESLQAIAEKYKSEARIEFVTGNLLRREDCLQATKGAAVIFHLAAGVSSKSVPDAFMNTVVTTRNLIEASLSGDQLKRFVSISSFAVYTNQHKSKRGVLDESCPVEQHPEILGDAYCYAKVKQDELVQEYGSKRGLPYVIVRPGSVYGPGKRQITGRIGIDTFGIFIHLGGANRIPFTYVDNCADAIVLAGLKPNINADVFNVVDDELPRSREFLRLYKQHVGEFRSIYLPQVCSYLLCLLWEKYSIWSKGQLPLAFNTRRWHVEIKRTQYTNEKLKSQLGWVPKVATQEGLSRFFKYCRESKTHA
jgi:nucleoside-diphosphate-sugar epimerase